jgi:hypothetical protein
MVAGAGCALALVAASGTAQRTTSPGGGPPASPTAARRTFGSAVRATRAPVIDGREDDDVWRSITPIRGFRQYDPGEDAPPTFETEFRVAYDNRYFYVLVRAFDPHPDSIQPLLSRRDVKTNSDQIGIIIDGFLDRRNALEFIVNPAGVKRDGAFYNDNTEDMSWDGVWDVAARVDEKGWVAEFRVPFSQLRFTARDVNTFGFTVAREIARLNQKDAWPVYRRSARTVVSQLGTIDGIRGVPNARRVELLPYAVTKSAPDLVARARGNHTDLTAGLDAKAGIGTSITVDATVNPDFGQVEADPAILNLTAFETRFEEKRPFFQEGIGLFRCGPPCDGPFYTRRIGRAPQLRASANDPAFTSILGAAKVTGRFSNGYTFAMLNAVTDLERGATAAVIEPQTNYMVVRAARESRDGTRQAGIMITDVRRQLDRTTDSLLRRSATAVIAQSTTRFARSQYELLLYAGRSFVTGSASAIALTQQSSVHYYQRPDHEAHYDPTRTSLEGGAFGASIKKIRGAVKFETFLRHSSPGQEMNDLGLVPTVNDMSIRQSIDLQQLSPNRWFRSAFSSIAAETHWTTGGLPASRSAVVHTSATLPNSWGGAITYSGTDFGGVNCVSCARGGPSLRRSPNHSIRFDLIGDPRLKILPKGQVHANVGDEGLSYGQGGELGVEVRVASQFSASIGGSYDRAVNDQQWYGNYGALLSDTTHYTFARLDQETLAITMRMNWTATPTLSFQFYGQPFVSAGSFSNWRQLGAPRAPGYSDRFRPYGNGARPSGFNVKQFNSNAVMRWEYRPASALFLVWQQGRNQDDLNRGSFEGQRDVRDLFAAPPQNTLLMKFSYWFNP